MSCIEHVCRAVLLALCCGWLLAGCASAGDPSTVPWNEPQPWEGVYSLPGLN